VALPLQVSPRMAGDVLRAEIPAGAPT